MSIHDIIAALHLNSIKEIGPARFQALIVKFGSSHNAVISGVESWGDVPFFDVDTLAAIKMDFDDARLRADRDLIQVEKRKVRLYLREQGPYPELLRQIAHPPPVIYAVGEDIAVSRPVIAVVGSRRCSYYGEKMACRISSELADADVTTISGLARGIDTHVHRSTLEAGGKTWAVVGSGLTHQYPPENKSLSRQIEENGAVISEFPMATRPFPANFPRRNRIIAGLSLGTVLVEGGEKSGSLITARLAAEEGRDVFAVPGPATSELSVAPNRLLQMGAAMAQCGEDILREIGVGGVGGRGRFPAITESNVAIPAHFRQVLGFLGGEPVPREILAQRLNKDAALLSSLLLEMELRGLIKSIPGGGVLKT